MSFYLSCLSTYYVFLPIMSFYLLCLSTYHVFLLFMSFYLSCLSSYYVFLPIMSFYLLCISTYHHLPCVGFLHTRVWSSDHQNACLWRGRVPRVRSNYDQGRWRWNCQLAKLGGMYKVRKCHSLVFPLKIKSTPEGQSILYYNDA